jgi:hypothetical protein
MVIHILEHFQYPLKIQTSTVAKKVGIENIPNVNLSINCLLDNAYQIIFKNVIEF